MVTHTRFSSKYLKLYSEDKLRFYGFGMTWGKGLMIILILRSNPLNQQTQDTTTLPSIELQKDPYFSISATLLTVLTNYADFCFTILFITLQ